MEARRAGEGFLWGKKQPAARAACRRESLLVQVQNVAGNLSKSSGSVFTYRVCWGSSWAEGWSHPWSYVPKSVQPTDSPDQVGGVSILAALLVMHIKMLNHHCPHSIQRQQRRQ